MRDDGPYAGGYLARHSKDGAQTSAEARRRPLVQYVIRRERLVGGGCTMYIVDVSPAGSKPSHELIDRPTRHATALSIERARASVPDGFKRMDRRKDDRADVVEVWV